MKKCPYCAEEIQEDAIKCRFCGEFLEKTCPALPAGRQAAGREKVKWYFKTPMLITAFLCIGPLALPFLWLNPRFSRNKKLVISAIVLILSYYLGAAVINSLKSVSKYYQFILGNI